TLVRERGAQRVGARGAGGASARDAQARMPMAILRRVRGRGARNARDPAQVPGPVCRLAAVGTVSAMSGCSTVGSVDATRGVAGNPDTGLRGRMERRVRGSVAADGGAGGVGGSPGPLEVVAAQPAGHVEYLADEVEAGDAEGL